MILKGKFPDITVLSEQKKKIFAHGFRAVASIKSYKDFKGEIYKFLSVILDENFKMLEPPLLVPTVRWKHNCILVQYEPHK